MGSESQPVRGRPKQLDRRSILEAATRIPTEEFSLRKLAQVLNVSSQSLYHYFPSKKSIADAIAQEVVRSVPVVSRRLNWREYMRQGFRGYRSWLLETNFQTNRPSPTDGFGVFRVAGHKSPELLKRFDDFFFVFRRDGFEVAAIVEIWVVYQNLLRRSDLHRAPRDALDEPFGNLQKDISGSETGDYPALEAVLDMDEIQLDNVYEAFLDVVIEGISVRYGVS